MVKEKKKEKTSKRDFFKRLFPGKSKVSQKEPLASVSENKKQPTMTANPKQNQASPPISLENKKTSEKESNPSKETNAKIKSINQAIDEKAHEHLTNKPVIEQSNTEEKVTPKQEVVNEQSETAPRPKSEVMNEQPETAPKPKPEVVNEQSEMAPRPAPRTTLDQPSLQAMKKAVKPTTKLRTTIVQQQEPISTPIPTPIPTPRNLPKSNEGSQKSLQTITSKGTQEAKKVGPPTQPKPKKPSHETHQR